MTAGHASRVHRSSLHSEATISATSPAVARAEGRRLLEYHARRSRQEDAAAIQASTGPAAVCHRALSQLHAERAMDILLGRWASLH